MKMYAFPLVPVLVTGFITVLGIGADHVIDAITPSNPTVGTEAVITNSDIVGFVVIALVVVLFTLCAVGIYKNYKNKKGDK